MEKDIVCCVGVYLKRLGGITWRQGGGGVLVFFGVFFEQIKVLSSKWIMYACKDMVIITDLLLFKWHLLTSPSVHLLPFIIKYFIHNASL